MQQTYYEYRDSDTFSPTHVLCQYVKLSEAKQVIG